MYKRKIRFISILMSVLIVFSTLVNALALTEGSEYDFNTTYTSVYYDWGYYQTADGEYHSASGQLAIRTLKSTGEPIYCLQAHKGTDGSSATASSLNKTYSWQYELNDSARRAITRVSIYGYRGNSINTYGYSSTDAQIATQMLIWEWQTTRRTSVSASASSYVTNVISGDTLACYNAILKACQNHTKAISWDKTSATLKGLGESSAVYFTDTSNILSSENYSVSSVSNSAVSAKIENKQLKVWANSHTSDNVSIELTKKMTNIGSAMCLTGAGQTMFYGAVADPVKTNITVNVQATGTMSFQKTMADNTALAQDETFTFNIYQGENTNGTLVKTITATILTGESSSETIDLTLDVGTYTIEEVLTDAQKQAGYVPQSAEVVEIKSNETTSVVFENEIRLGKVAVQKTADACPTGYLGKFKFAVLKCHGNKIVGISNYETNANGYAEFDKITSTEITAGQADGGFNLRLAEFRIVNDVNNATPENFVFPTSMKAYKKDGQSTTALNFLDYDDFSNVCTNIGELDNFLYGRITTDDVVISEPLNFNIADVADTGNVLFEVHNTLQMGEIKIKKTGRTFTSVLSSENSTTNTTQYKPQYNDDETLAGVTFQVYAREDVVVNGRTIYTADEAIDTPITTGVDGTVTKKLYLGKYYAKEIATVDGYILDTTEHDFELTATNNTDTVFSTTKDIFNERATASVKLTKTMQTVNSNGVVRGNNGEINNVIFGLYANENIVGTSGTIPKDGLIEVLKISSATTNTATLQFTTELPLGKYYVKEIATDSNYLIDNTKYAFEFSPIDNTTETINIDLGTIVNTPKGDIVGVKKDAYGTVVAGAKFKLYAQADIYDENYNIVYVANAQVGNEVTSDANGKFSWSGLYHGSYYIKETYTPTPYVLPTEIVASDIYINVENTVQTVNISNTHKVGQIKIIKTANQFSGVTSTTSDGKTVYTPTYTTKGLAGVKFNIYAAEDIYLNGNKIVDNGYKMQSDLVTDANGEVTSIELPLGKYRIVETYAPGGYVKSADQYVEVKNDTNARVATTTKTIFNERATAQAEVVKIMQFVEKHGIIHGNKGEIKNVTLGLFANETITATNGQSIPKDGLIEMQKVDVTTNTATFNFIKDIPFGSYYIQEIATDGAYFLNGVKREFTFKPTSDNTQKDNKFTLESITNYAKGDIVGVKTDAYGTVIVGAKFKLYAQDVIYDEYGNEKYAKDAQVGEEVTSDANGKFSWSGLYYGSYYIKETYTPTSYVLPVEEVASNINISVNNTVQSVNISNTHKMGKIEINKTANQFSGVSLTVSDGKTIYTPTYATKGLAGVKFDIYAAEDIYLNGKKIVDNGYKFQTDLTTNTDGLATSIELPLGKYKIVETYAPYGYIKSADQYVTLASSGNNRVTTTTKSIFNERVTAQVEVEKVMQLVNEYGIKHGNNGEITNVVFGLFANETLTATNGQSIPKNALIEVQTVNATTNTATFKFIKDIPFGSYYIKEIATDNNYFIDDTKHTFDFFPTDNTTKTVSIVLDEIVNYAKGDIVGVKKDIDGEIVAGCKFQLYAKSRIYDANGNMIYDSGKKIGEEVTSDANGKFSWSGLYYGTYLIVETYAPQGYVVPTLAVKSDIGISVDNTVQSVEIENKYTSAEFIKLDENGNPLSGAKFALYKGNAPNGSPIATWVSGNAPKVFTKLAFGDYVIVEIEAPNGYELLGEVIPFTIENTDVRVKISKKDLPHTYLMTGGHGDLPYILSGGLILGVTMIFATVRVVIKKRKERFDY